MSPHPSPAELLGGGRAVAAHVAECPECRRLAELLVPAPAGPRYARRGVKHAGGMGRTVLAWDTVLEREVLLKEAVVPPELSAAAVHRRFVREARVTAALAHPSILAVHDLGDGDDGAPFYVMPFVEGRTLTEEIAATAPEARLELVSRVAAVADAVAYAHSRGVVHRDIKPDNVLVGAFGQVVVIDWGLAARVGSSAEGPADEPPGDGLTARGVGTPAYMPAEQADGQAADPRQDVYAIGATLYHCLTGQPPWAGRSGATIREAHASGRAPAPLAALAPRAPPELLSLVERAMAVDPRDRFPDAIPLANELRRFLDGALLETHRYSPLERARRWLWERRAWVAPVAAALVAASGVGAVSLGELARSRDAALVGLARALAAQSALEAADPHRTADALASAVQSVDASAAPLPEAVAALRGAIHAGPAAGRVPGLAGWGPALAHRGRLLIADPAGRALLVGAGGLTSTPLGVGHPVHAAFAPDGADWLVVGDDGRVQIGARAVFATGGRRGGFLDADTILVAGDAAAEVRDLAGGVREVFPLPAPMTSVAFGAGQALVGDRDGAVHVRAPDGGWSTVQLGASAVTALALDPDGQGFAGAADGRVWSLHGRELARLARPITSLDAAGDCLAVATGFDPGEVVSAGPRCAARGPRGAIMGRLRADGGAVVALHEGRACAFDLRTGAPLSCVPAPLGALGGGFVDGRAAYVIGFDGVVLFDAAPAVAPHDSELVGAWPAGPDAVWTASRAGAVRYTRLGGGVDREVARLDAGISAAAARGETLWAGGFDGSWVAVGPDGVRRRGQLRDAVGALWLDDAGGFVATLDGSVARFDGDLSLGRSWEVPGGVWRLIGGTTVGLVTLGLDGVARAWSEETGEPGPTYGGPEDNIGWAEVAADGAIWLRTRTDTVRWEAGAVTAHLDGRLVGQASDGRLVTADPSGAVFVYDAGGALLARWNELRPPRAVSRADTLLGDGGEVRSLDGAVLRRGGGPLAEELIVGGWRVAGGLDGSVTASPVAAPELRALACERLSTLFRPFPCGEGVRPPSPGG